MNDFPQIYKTRTDKPDTKQCFLVLARVEKNDWQMYQPVHVGLPATLSGPNRGSHGQRDARVGHSRAGG